MQHVSLAGPLVIGGTLKIFYDLLLFRAFRHVRPPEEEREPPSETPPGAAGLATRHPQPYTEISG